MKIQYIAWYYGKSGRENLHLIRLQDGRGLLKTDSEMLKLGLAKRKVPTHWQPLPEIP